MTIDKISGVSPQWYKAAQPADLGAMKKKSVANDSITISSSAQDRFNEKRIETARARLNGFIQDGVIDSKVLDKITEKIAAELRSADNSHFRS